MKNPNARNCPITFKTTVAEKEKYEIAAIKEGIALSEYIYKTVRRNHHLLDALLKAKETGNEYKRRFMNQKL